MALQVQYSAVAPPNNPGFAYVFNRFGPLLVGYSGGQIVENEPSLTPGTYTGIALTSIASTALGVIATVTVGVGGTVTGVTITSGGANCVYTDIFSASTSFAGGTGNFQWWYDDPTALASSSPITIDAYGTGGTSGVGGAGTYQTTAGAAAQFPSAGAGGISSAVWIVNSGGGAVNVPPTFAPPVNTDQVNNTGNPILPNLGAAAPFIFAGANTFSPPPPLPQTATGTNTTTSYSS